MLICVLELEGLIQVPTPTSWLCDLALFFVVSVRCVLVSVGDDDNTAASQRLNEVALCACLSTVHAKQREATPGLSFHAQGIRAGRFLLGLLGIWHMCRHYILPLISHSTHPFASHIISLFLSTYCGCWGCCNRTRSGGHSKAGRCSS